MNVTYVDHMGEDLDVAKTAWCSTKSVEGRTEEEAKRVIKFLARNNHKSPFFQNLVKLNFHIPIFILRQLMRHKTGTDWNEQSFRYVVDDNMEFYFPKSWRSSPKKRMQGSGDDLPSQHLVTDIYRDGLGVCISIYTLLIKEGVAPEQARMVLPMSTYTNAQCTMSMYAAYNICQLRTANNAQKEIGELAKMIGDVCSNLWPYGWRALNES